MIDIVNNIINDNSAFSSFGYFDKESSIIQDDVQQDVRICISRRSQYIMAMFTAWHAGFYVVPLNTDWRAQKNRDTIDCSQLAAVLVDNGASLDTQFLVLTTSKLFAAPDAAVNEDSRHQAGRLLASDMAYLIYTSGSTVASKGVVIPVGALRAYVESMRRFFGAYASSQLLLLDDGTGQAVLQVSA